MMGLSDEDREQLWRRLGVKDDDAIIDVMLLAKTRNMANGDTGVCIGDLGMDWVAQVGLLRAAQVLVEREEPEEP